MKKRLLSALMAGVLAVSLAACGSSSSSDSGTESAEETESSAAEADSGSGEGGSSGKDTLNIAFTSDPLSLAPNGNSSSGFITAQLYDQLWFLTDGERIMRLAESLEFEDDTHMLITIQDGVTDTAGNELTASDVLFSIELAQNGTEGYPGATRYIDVENSEVVDDTTVRVALTQACSFQADALSMVNIVSEASYNESEDGMVTTPVGSGPYVMKEYVTGSYIVLEANEEYWEGAPEIKEVTVQFISEESQRTNALLTGEVDLAADISYVDVATIDSMDGLDVKITDTLGCSVVFFNCSSTSVCDNTDLRKAIATAINTDACRNASYGGYASDISVCTSPNFGDYDEAWAELAADTDYYAYDLDAAKEYLAASGIEEGTEIRLVHNGSNAQAAEAEVIQACLADLGLSCTLVSVPDTTTTYVTSQPEDWDIVLWSWTNFPAQSSLATLNTFMYTSNYMHLEGEEQETIFGEIEAAVACQDEDEKSEIMLSLYQDLYDILPVYGMYNIQNIYAQNSDLEMVYKCNAFPVYAHCSWN